MNHKSKEERRREEKRRKEWRRGGDGEREFFNMSRQGGKPNPKSHKRVSGCEEVRVRHDGGEWLRLEQKRTWGGPIKMARKDKKQQ